MPELEVEGQVTPEGVEETPETAAVPEAASETEEQESHSEASEAKPVKGGFQRKIDKLTREKYELQGRLKALQEERERKAESASDKSKSTTDADPEPKPENFDTYEQYVKAQARWEARQEFSQLTAKQKEEQRKFDIEQHAREVMEAYNESLAEFREEHEDFDQVVGGIKLFEEVGNAVQNTLLEDEHGAALAYWIGQHPEEVDKLNQMSATAAVKYVGRLAERLFPENAGTQEEADEESPSPKSTPRTPSLPAPIAPTRRASPTDKGLSDNLSVKEWEARFRKQMGYDK